MFCPACGNELPSDAQFCSDCGMEIITIPISKPVSTQGNNVPIRNNQNASIQTPVKIKKNKISAAIIMVIIIVSSVGIYFAAMALTWDNISGSQTYSFIYTGETPPTSTDFYLEIGTADVNINYNTTLMEEIVKINLNYDISGGFLEGKSLEDVYDIFWDTHYFDMDLKWYMSFIQIDNSVINLTLRTDMIYTLQTDIGTGDVNAIIPDDVTFEYLEITTSTGNINIVTGDNLNVTDYLKVESSTGTINFKTGEYSTINGLNIDTSTGDVLANIGDYSNLTSIVYLKSSTGEVTYINSNSDYNGNIQLDTGTGDLILNITNPHYTDSTYIFDWVLDTGTGDIFINFVQNSPLNANISISSDTGTGDIFINYAGKDAFAGAKLYTYDSDETYIISMTGFSEVNENMWKSTGYETAVNIIDFYCDIGTGDIELTLENS